MAFKFYRDFAIRRLLPECGEQFTPLIARNFMREHAN
jgi:hypothetical protein